MSGRGREAPKSGSKPTSSLFDRDSRSAEEKLAVLASIGCESPEVLTLVEIKALCQALLHLLSPGPASPAERSHAQRRID